MHHLVTNRLIRRLLLADRSITPIGKLSNEVVRFLRQRILRPRHRRLAIKNFAEGSIAWHLRVIQLIRRSVMKTEHYTAYIATDWGDQEHAIALQVPARQRLNLSS